LTTRRHRPGVLLVAAAAVLASLVLLNGIALASGPPAISGAEVAWFSITQTQATIDAPLRREGGEWQVGALAGIGLVV
jgi:hypothetical protein